MWLIADCAFHAEIREVDTSALNRLLCQDTKLTGLKKRSRRDADVGRQGSQHELLAVMNQSNEQFSANPASLMFRRNEKPVDVPVTCHVGKADRKAVDLRHIGPTPLEPL